MKAKFSLLSLLLIIYLSGAYAQNVTGIVSDTEGVPLIGVTVQVKGTNSGTITDLSGVYTLQGVAEDATLIFSYVGFTTQEVSVNGRSEIDITLAAGIEIDEVLVMGYTIQTKEEVTGAVSQVKGGEIASIPVANLDNLLQGKAPGLVIQSGSGLPGSNATNVILRGITSINSGTNPLYIMDGVPINPADFGAINPNDIESINVLKDASASLYGARSANGVIVITTKKGTAGDTKIDLKTQFGFSFRPQDNIDLMSTEELLSFENYVGGGGAGSIYGPDGSAPNPMLYDSLRRINTDYEEVILRPGISQSYEVGISGGSEQIQYYISGNYFSQEGIVENSDYKRGGLRANLTGKKNNFEFSVNTSTGYAIYNLPSTFDDTDAGNGDIYSNPISGIYWGIPYESIYLPDGSFAPLIGAGGDNWVEQFEEWQQQQRQLKFVGSAKLGYEFIPGLKLSTTLGLDFLQAAQDDIIPPNTFYGTTISSGGQGDITNIFDESKDYIITTVLNYRNYHGEGDKHLVDGLIGNELVYDSGDRSGFQVYGLNDKDLSPGGATEGVATPIVLGGTSAESLVSMFLNGSYTYDSKYSLGLGFRRDASSKFGEANKWANFWNIGASWVASNESFLKGSDKVNLLKLRLSYGTLGNSNIARTDKFTAYGPTNYDGNPGIAPATLGNDELKWETTKIVNLGVDFELMSRHIRGTLEFYNKKTEDLFIQDDVSLSTGFTSVNRNAGTIRNRGVELSLEFDLYRNKALDMVLTARGNYALNKSKVLDLGGVSEFILGTSIVREGLPFGTHYVVEFAGVDPATGQPLYYDDNGSVTTEFSNDFRNTNSGSYVPKHTGNAGLDFTIKGFYASIDFNYMLGHSVYNTSLPFYSLDPTSVGIQNFLRDMLDVWTTPGQVTDVQSPFNLEGGINPLDISSRYIEDASFIKLKSIKMGYRITKLPDPLRYINIYAQAQNLYFWSDLTTGDPETWNNASFYFYPNPRIVTFGVDFGF